MRTRLTDLLGIEHPIVQGGMHFVGFAKLAAAVSNAGGLGVITALTQRTPELLAIEIARCREMTDKPFGVNLTFLPAFSSPPYPEYIEAIVDGGVTIVETAVRSPEPYMPAFKKAGLKVIHKCTSVRHALTAERIGCDAVSVDGFECGGHPGEDDVPNMILLPRAAEALTVPLLASGGMADARSLVAALALGAEGINMGTRFIATREAPVHENVKRALLEADESDTRLIMRPLRNTERVLNNASVTRLLEIEREKGDALTIDDIIENVAGVYPKVMLDGDMDAGAWSCGMVVGLIHDIPSVDQLISQIMDAAESLIRSRLTGLLDNERGATPLQGRESDRLSHEPNPKGGQQTTGYSAVRSRHAADSSRRWPPRADNPANSRSVGWATHRPVSVSERDLVIGEPGGIAPQAVQRVRGRLGLREPQLADATVPACPDCGRPAPAVEDNRRAPPAASCSYWLAVQPERSAAGRRRRSRRPST